MPRLLLAFFLAAPSVVADDLRDLPSPFEKAKPGDWTEYRMRTEVEGGNVFDATVRQTVLSVTEDEARIENRFTVLEQTRTIEWTAPRRGSWWDAFRAEMAAEDMKVELVDGEVADVPVTVEERTHPGRRIRAVVAAEQVLPIRTGGTRTVRLRLEFQVLATDAVPVTGRVRAELVGKPESEGESRRTVLTELTEFGGN